MIDNSFTVATQACQLWFKKALLTPGLRVAARRGSDLGGLRRAARHPQRHVAPDDVREVARRRRSAASRTSAARFPTARHDSRTRRATAAERLRTCASCSNLEPFFPNAFAGGAFDSGELAATGVQRARPFPGAVLACQQRRQRALCADARRLRQAPAANRTSPATTTCSWPATGPAPESTAAASRPAVLSGRAAARAIAGLPVPAIHASDPFHPSHHPRRCPMALVPATSTTAGSCPSHRPSPAGRRRCGRFVVKADGDKLDALCKGVFTDPSEERSSTSRSATTSSPAGEWSSRPSRSARSPPGCPWNQRGGVREPQVFFWVPCVEIKRRSGSAAWPKSWSGSCPTSGSTTRCRWRRDVRPTDTRRRSGASRFPAGESSLVGGRWRRSGSNYGPGNKARLSPDHGGDPDRRVHRHDRPGAFDNVLDLAREFADQIFGTRDPGEVGAGIDFYVENIKNALKGHMYQVFLKQIRSAEAGPRRRAPAGRPGALRHHGSARLPAPASIGVQVHGFRRSTATP